MASGSVPEMVALADGDALGEAAESLDGAAVDDELAEGETVEASAEGAADALPEGAAASLPYEAPRWASESVRRKETQRLVSAAAWPAVARAKRIAQVGPVLKRMFKG